VEDDGTRRRLRAGFDEAAEAYQRTRPVCPPQLFDDLVRLAGLAPGDRVAEIGCGTGQATVPLAERGLAVTAVELGAALAAGCSGPSLNDAAGRPEGLAGLRLPGRSGDRRRGSVGAAG
jgi:SAM-dependent methyltransferase